ncbi:hypothetical protein PQR63_19435 [Herbaspirillum rhizosphaerae]|uniref:DUF3098 family protein n=1 Tax=Herbaspirillum rhizosphaerae TaxID=346179 RepID=A0ABW8ZDZ6_9BURK
MDKNTRFRKLIKRAVIAYSGGVAMVLFYLGVSVSYGKGFEPLLIPLPLFIIVFGGITYQLLKELKALKREAQQEP